MKRITDEKGVRVRRAYGIFFGAWTAVVAALFLVQVWRIFLTGGNAPFTVESISEKWRQIAAPVYIWLVAVVGGVAVWTAFPEQEKITAYKDEGVTLKKLRRRLPISGERKVCARTIAWLALAVIAVVSTVVALLYMLSYETKAQTGFFASHEEAERIVRALPWIVAAFGAGIFAVVFDTSEKKKEIEQVKAQIAENAKKGVKVPVREEKRSATQPKGVTLVIRAALAVAGVVLVIVGIAGGGMADVLEKAINICTQCIGLG